MNYKISNKDIKAFILNRSEVEERLQPKFYTEKYLNNEHRINASKFPVKHLSEVTELISDGTHFTPIYLAKGVKFISVKDVRRSKINLDNPKYIAEEEANKLDKRCKPQLGDILLTKIGATYGFAAVVETEERFQIFVSLALLRPKKIITSKFLEVFLNTDLAYIQFERVIKGAGVPDLHLEDIRKIKIPIPDINTQNKIANIYTAAFQKKSQKEAEAKALLLEIDKFLLVEVGMILPVKETKLHHRIFKTTFRKVVGSRLDPLFFKNAGKIESSNCKNFTLRKIVNIEKGQSITKDKITEGNYPVIGGGQSSPYSHSLYNQSGNIITVSASGAYAGFVWYHDYPIFASDCIVLQSKDENVISTRFLYFVLKALQKEIYKLQQGAGQPHVYARDLEKISIPVPSLSIQNKMLSHINTLQKKGAALQQESLHVLDRAKKDVEKILVGS